MSLSALAGLYAAIGSSWTSISTSLFTGLAAYVGKDIAGCLTHALLTQITFLTFFWPMYLFFRWADNTGFLARYKMHPNKWEPQTLNDKVWDGLTSAQAPIRGFGRMAMVYWVFFWRRQDSFAVPSFTNLLLNQAMAYTINDFLFYWLHRAEHEVPYLYKYWHKKHHEFKVSNVGATSWNYWQESFGIMVCGNISAMLVGMSLFEYQVWIFNGICNDAHVHCGYRLPWDFMNLVNPPEWHDFHHYKNVGNYSTGFPFWDVLFGPDNHYREYVARNEALLKAGKEEEGENREEPIDMEYDVVKGGLEGLVKEE